MKWIVIAILLFLVPYTIITLRYRKPNEPFRPYEDMQNRATVSRLLSAGYRRIPLPAQRPADALRNPPPAASLTPVLGGLPQALTETLVKQPLLPASIANVAAAPEVAASEPYTIRFACVHPDEQRQLAGADLYLRDNDIIIAPDFEKLGGQLLARTRDNVVELVVPAGTFAPGRYEVLLAGANESRRWSLNVR